MAQHITFPPDEVYKAFDAISNITKCCRLVSAEFSFPGLRSIGMDDVDAASWKIPKTYVTFDNQEVVVILKFKRNPTMPMVFRSE